MYRARLRPKYSDDLLKVVYPEPHNHLKWADHHIRVNATIELAKWLVIDTNPLDVADLSCGNGAIAKAMPYRMLHLGDFAPGYDIQGPIEETIHQIPSVDLFILSETLEHLDDPDAILKEIRQKSKYLVMSTPIAEHGDGNPEHYWGWDQEAIRHMLSASGWQSVVQIDLKFSNPGYYDFQLWGCK